MPNAINVKLHRCKHQVRKIERERKKNLERIIAIAFSLDIKRNRAIVFEWHLVILLIFINEIVSMLFSNREKFEASSMLCY